jgi:Uma2 family endonuclease
MTAERARDQLICPEDYLEGEARAETKHEYLNGVVYAMAGGTNLHNRIKQNILRSLGNRLAGGPCETFDSDTKVRLQSSQDVRFYYPDVLVTCEPNPPSDVFQDKPCLIAEVISESTRRTDESEKKDAYLLLPSVQAYLLVETERALVVVYRRVAGDFVREAHVGLDASIPLPFLKTELPLKEIYERVEFPAAGAAS